MDIEGDPGPGARGVSLDRLRTMTATVAIPTYNRPESLARALASLSATDVLVVDDGSRAPSSVKREAMRFGARYVWQDHGGVNVARNTAMREAGSDLVALIDDDIQTPPGWLDALLAGAARHPKAGALAGPAILRVEGHAPRMCPRETLADTAMAPMEEGPTDRLLGGNMLVRREAWEAAGPFDPRLSGPNDETEWLRRVQAAGFELVHIPAATAWHIRTTQDLRLRTNLPKAFRYGRASVLPSRLLGENPTFTSSVKPIPRYLAHAISARCASGLTMSARAAGVAVGSLRRP